MSEPTSEVPAPDGDGSHVVDWPVVFAVAASLFVFAAIRAPVPGANEPHYLTKARHFWNPDWCAGDFFLESSNPHRVFYSVVGVLTRFLPFPIVAWLGRAVGHLLLAFGWTALVSRCASGRWSPLFAGWAFLSLVAIGNLAGEWIARGVEAKVVGFGLVFLALALVVDRRWSAASASAGLAVAWHPLVGAWALVAAFVPVMRLLVRRNGVPRNGVDAPRVPWFIRVKTVVSCGFAFSLCALPGLWPVVELLGQGNEKTAFAADFIQVDYRLAHHLDPMALSPIAAAVYTVAFAGWLWARRRLPPSRGENVLAGFVVGTVVIALIGLLIGFRTVPLRELPFESIAWRVKLLKFYWFRMADVFVPIAVAVTVVRLVTLREGGTRLLGRVTGLCFAVSLCFPGADGTGSKLSAEDRRDWRETCAWIRENTPRAAVFSTPNSAIAFKWYAERAEYVALKDCPQDPGGIVEWNRRLQFLADWGERHYADERYTEDEMRALARRIRVDYFVAWHLGPIEMEPVYENDTFRVYDLRE